MAEKIIDNIRLYYELLNKYKLHVKSEERFSTSYDLSKDYTLTFNFSKKYIDVELVPDYYHDHENDMVRCGYDCNISFDDVIKHKDYVLTEERINECLAKYECGTCCSPRPKKRCNDIYCLGCHYMGCDSLDIVETLVSRIKNGEYDFIEKCGGNLPFSFDNTGSKYDSDDDSDNDMDDNSDENKPIETETETETKTKIMYAIDSPEIVELSNLKRRILKNIIGILLFKQCDEEYDYSDNETYVLK